MYKKRRKIERKRRDNENKLKQQLRCPLPTNEEPHGGVQIIILSVSDIDTTCNLLPIFAIRIWFSGQSEKSIQTGEQKILCFNKVRNISNTSPRGSTSHSLIHANFGYKR